jgi:hypothetical protein
MPKTKKNWVDYLLNTVLFVSIIVALVLSVCFQRVPKPTESKPKTVVTQQGAYSDSEIQQMFRLVKQIVYERILEGKSPYPCINERFVLMIKNIHATYHTNVSFQCVSSRYNRCDAVAGSCIGDDGRPTIKMFIPSVMDYARTIATQYTNTIEQQVVFFDFLLLATMHEFEHLMEPISTEITQSNMIELEISAWARTCENECKPLVEMNHKLSEPAGKLYKAWVATNGDEKSPQWRDAVRKIMEKYDVGAMPTQ